jgi:hypothetical protein
MKIRKGEFLDKYKTQKSKLNHPRPRFCLKAYYQIGRAVLELADDYQEEGIIIERIPNKIGIWLGDELQLRKSEVAWYLKKILMDFEQGKLIERSTSDEYQSKTNIRL